MFKSTLAKALLGVAGLGLAGGTTALAATPGGSPSPSARQQTAAKRHLATSRGVVVKVSATELTIHHPEARRDAAATGATPTADNTTFELTKTTAVYRAGDPGHKLGLDALKVGDRVRVAYADNAAKAHVARRVVILPEVRAGRLVSKDIDPSGKETLHLRTAKGDTILVTITPETKFYEGRKGRTQGSFTDMKVSQRVVVLGKADGNDNFDAASVRYFTPDRAAKAAPSTSASPAA